jgi:hypothetical protein
MACRAGLEPGLRLRPDFGERTGPKPAPEAWRLRPFADLVGFKTCELSGSDEARLSEVRVCSAGHGSTGDSWPSLSWLFERE